MNYNSNSCNNEKEQRNMCSTIISCSNPGQSVTTSTTQTTAASVTLNTACIDNPCIKFNFTAIGIYTNSQTLSFQLTKVNVCFQESQTNVSSPVTIILPVPSAPNIISVDIVFCDCYTSDTPCNNCNQYSIVVTSNRPTGGAVLFVPTLSAISTCNGNSCCKN